MSYNSLIIFLTNRCKAGCATCNVDAAPGNTGMLHPDDLDSIFNNSSLTGSSGKYILWTGGEPFESFSSLVYGIGLADRSGFRSEILTAGYWYDKEKLHLTKLHEAGNFSLRISIDPEHLKFTGIDILTLLISESIETGTEVNFTVREINENQNIVSVFFKNIKRSFPEYYRRRRRDHRWIHHIPHVPVSKNDPYTEIVDFAMVLGAWRVPVKQTRRTRKNLGAIRGPITFRRGGTRRRRSRCRRNRAGRCWAIST